MNLNDLLKNEGIDPQHVLVLRHRPHEPELNKVFPWLAAERPKIFNAYQQTQTRRLEQAMKGMIGSGYVASFIGHEPGKALFIGLYSILDARPVARNKYWRIPGYMELKAFGMKGIAREDPRKSILLFDLKLSKFCASWKGKLIVGWPPPERSWWRRSHRNDIPILAILEESALDAAMPEWNKIVLTWKDLSVIPAQWKSALSQWRGIYFIFDTSDGKGYVGSAYGEANLYGRWRNYAKSGHGGNCLLKRRDPNNFRFSILQRVSPDMDAHDVIQLENSWKERLHTRHPDGLNDN